MISSAVAITAVGDYKMHGTYQQYETTGNSCKEIFFTGIAQMQFSYSKVSISVTRLPIQRQHTLIHYLTLHHWAPTQNILRSWGKIVKCLCFSSNKYTTAITRLMEKVCFAKHKLGPLYWLGVSLIRENLIFVCWARE